MPTHTQQELQQIANATGLDFVGWLDAGDRRLVPIFLRSDRQLSEQRQRVLVLNGIERPNVPHIASADAQKG